MQRTEMIQRTKQFALRIIKLVSALPNNQIGRTIGNQVLRSGTAIGANYREASRASTKRHFTSILTIALREADETQYWLELLIESGVVKAQRIQSLLKESGELVAILTASVRTASR